MESKLYSTILVKMVNIVKEYDYMRGLGRGISTFRTTTFYQDDLWAVNDKMDQTDLRHSAETGNWMHMEKLKCNNPDSEFFWAKY